MMLGSGPSIGNKFFTKNFLAVKKLLTVLVLCRKKCYLKVYSGADISFQRISCKRKNVDNN